MTVEDVRRIFAPKVVDEYLILPDGSLASIDFFANVLFKDASANPTYNELASIDGGVKGYIPFFDQCRAEGLLQ
jgi:hypothetical protein